MKSEDFQAKFGKRKMRTGYDGQAVIRARLTEMKIPFREEVVFSNTRKFRADFVIIGEHSPCIIEYSGATHVKGGHSSGAGITRDAEKLNHATVEGFQYIIMTVDLLRKPLYFEGIIRSIVYGNHPEKNYKGNKGR